MLELFMARLRVTETWPFLIFTINFLYKLVLVEFGLWFLIEEQNTGIALVTPNIFVPSLLFC
jgi:hypothetical protein